MYRNSQFFDITSFSEVILPTINIFVNSTIREEKGPGARWSESFCHQIFFLGVIVLLAAAVVSESAASVPANP